MRRIRTLVLAVLCIASLAAPAQQGGDLQAQIVYAFYVEDTNALAGLEQLLMTQEQAGASDAALRYDLAHVRYREGLLNFGRKSSAAAAAFAGCIDALKPLVEKEPDNVEALALQSACYSNLARLRKLEAVLLRARADERIGRASTLAPHNPRVLLLRALQGLDRARPGPADSARVAGVLEQAAEAFEQSITTSVDVPGWGHAETCLELGRQLQGRGDFIGARDWLEKALLVAPDFKAAQRQLTSFGAALSVQPPSRFSANLV